MNNFTKGIFIPLLSLVLFNGCKKEIVYVEKEPPIDLKQAKMLTFSIKPTNNPDYINETIQFSIEDSVITGRIPFYTNIKSLKVSFESEGKAVMVDGVPQVSGETVNDFSKPITYHLVDDQDNLKAYTVKMINFTGLPVVKIYTEASKAINSKENYVNADITIDGAGEFEDFAGSMKIKGRGNTTWSLPKKPYKFKFDKKQSILGLPADKEWVLLANYNDKSSLRTDAAFFLGAASSLAWTPKANFVELIVNDVYMGNYQMGEGVTVSSSRVNVSDDGYLLEVDQLSRMEPGDVYFYTNRILMNIKEPEVSLNDAKFNYIKNYVTEAETALYGSDFKDDVKGYRKYLDVNSFVDWYLINEISKNNDAIFFSSCYMNLTPGGKLKMGPIWDFDIAFGNINYNENQAPEGYFVKNAAWISRLFEDPEFVQLVKSRFAYFKSKKTALFDNINNKSVMLKWSAREDDNKWKTFYTNTGPNYAVIGSYNSEVQYLKDWINKRFNWLDAEFAKL